MYVLRIHCLLLEREDQDPSSTTLEIPCCATKHKEPLSCTSPPSPPYHQLTLSYPGISASRSHSKDGRTRNPRTKCSIPDTGSSDSPRLALPSPLPPSLEVEVLSAQKEDQDSEGVSLSSSIIFVSQ
jgi:hypothetical protein